MSDFLYQRFLDDYAGAKEVPFENILWNAALFGPKPANLHFKYKPVLDGSFTYVIYLEVRDAEGNFIGIQLVDNVSPDIHKQDATTIGTVWFMAYGSSEQYLPQYLFYIDDSSEMLHTKTQWAALSNGSDGIWATDASWKTKRPTQNQVVKNWADTIPLVAAQTKVQQRLGYLLTQPVDIGVYLKAPMLTKTPTPSRWFYNEEDGYFYYIGLLKSQESMLPPMDCSDPQFNASDLYQSFFSDFSFRVYGEAVEANKDAITAAWGLTFELGSLGSAILASE